MRILLSSALALLLTLSAAVADTVVYEFDIGYRTVSPAGKPVEAMTVGGSLPAPLIEANIGDILRVTFNNKMDVATSIHWHGVLLPPDQDGVPHLNTRPIEAGSSFTFEFPIKHTGTYWYHSHTGLQEQRGIYGPLVFRPKKEAVSADREHVITFSDWTNERPERVLRNLKRDGDYYARKKGSVASWDKVIAHGGKAIEARLEANWSRMGPMDVSDVGYDAFLANGEAVHRLAARPGERVRLRLVNAAASSYFDVEFAGGAMTIVAADGLDIEPTVVKRLRMAVAETYDVIVTMPEVSAYELRATATDGTGYASAILGQGEVVGAPDVPKPGLFMAMDHGDGGHGVHVGHGGMTGPVTHMTDYSPLRAPAPTSYSPDRPVRELDFTLNGDMERYVWTLNKRTLSESERILIRKGEVVRFRMINKTMMDHPMHLHGHFFRVLNGAGALSPLKHTVNVPAMGEVTIEFLANEERDWFFHCHVLYHMMSGMAAVVSYEETSQADGALLRKLSHDRDWFAYADTGFQSNKATGRLWARNSRYEAALDYDYDWKHAYEIDARFERRIGRWLGVYGGVYGEDERGASSKTVGTFGARYILPFLVEADLRVETNGHVRLELGSEIQLLDRLSFHWEWNTDDEYELGLEVEITKGFSLTASHGNDFGTGAGLLVKF